MKKLLPFLILSATTTLTFAQGIVNFFNDSLHAVYFTADTTNLLSADTGLALNAMPANGTALPSGSILYADLWAGSASDNMTLQATSSQWSISKGRWSAKMVTLSNLPSNQLGYFQVVISTNIVGPGTVVLSPTNPVPFRTIVTASAIAAPGNYFKLWSGAASGTNSPTTFAVTTPTPTLSALFTAVPEGKCTLNVVVNGMGTVTVNPQQPYYTLGDTVTMTAVPTNPAATFVGWSQDASGNANPPTLVLNTNKVVGADFGAAPTVTVSPSSVIVLAVSNAVLHAYAAGLPPLSYQWFHDAAPTAGATNGTYGITNAGSADAGSYSVVVTNAYGSGTSGVATVTVVWPPSISVQPLSQTLPAGTPLNLSVVADGTAPLRYQWHSNLGVVAGATNADFSPGLAQITNAGDYFVVVTNAYGTITSAVATVVVYVPVSISIPPASQGVPAHATAGFGVVASGYPAPAYQWIFLGTNLPGATTSTLTITNVRLSDCGEYTVLVGNGYPSDQSASATLSMSPTIIAPYAGTTAIWGRSATLSVGAVGSGSLSYQWLRDGVPIDFVTNQTYTVPVVQLNDGGFYTVVVSSPWGSVTNTPAQLIVNPAGMDLGLYAGIAFSGLAGYSYEIQYTMDLTVTNSWVTLTNLTLQQPMEIWVDTTTNAAITHKRFYRIFGAQHLPDAAAHIGTIRLNHNDQFTTNLAVTLDLQAVDNGTGVSQMQFSNDDENWSAPEPYQPMKTWQLVDDGTYPPQMRTVLKTVFVRFQDGAGNWSKAVSASIVLAKSPADVPRIQEVWIAQQLPSDYVSGDPPGSQRNPYLVPAGTNEATFDTLMYSLMTNYCAYQPQAHWTTNPPGPATNTTALTIHLGPGTYETHGDNQVFGETLSWHPQNGWRIFGAGRDVTTLKAVDVRYGYYSRVTVIGSFDEFCNLGIADLTIDANIHEGGTNMTGQFSQAMGFCGSNLQIRRVKVKNSGSHMGGGEPAAIGLLNWGCEFDNYNLILEDCEVGHPQIGNAYAPNLVGISGQFGADGKMRWYRNVVVRNCYCDGTVYDGETPIDASLYPLDERANTAFGIGGTWGAVIEDNVAVNTMSGYYVDSVSLHSLVVRNNNFRNVVNGAQIVLYSSADHSLTLEDSFRFEGNLVELDPRFYPKGENWGTYGYRFAFLLYGNVKGSAGYSLNRVILTNNVFQFADLQAPDAGIAGVRGFFRGVRTADVENNVFRGLALALTWDNDPQYLAQQVDIVEGSCSPPVICHNNTSEDGTRVEIYPYVLDKSLPRLAVVEGQEISLPAPALDDLAATVADGLPLADSTATNGVFRWQTTSQDAGTYVVSFYDSPERHRDNRRTLITVLDRGPGNDAHYFANGLMGYWRFNETSGASLGDSSGNGYSIDASRPLSNQLLTLGVAAPAAAGAAVHLNARNTAVAEVLCIFNSDAHLLSGYPVLFHPFLGKSTSLYHPFSIALWFKADSEPQRDQVIFRQYADGGSFYCEITPGTNTTDQKVGLLFIAANGYISPSTPAVYPVSAWHQLVIVYDGVSVRLAVDGAKAAEQACGQLTGFSPTCRLVLGGSFGDDPYVGSLAKLAVWNRPLSDGEITRIYGEQSAGAEQVLTPVAASRLDAQLLSATTPSITWQDNSTNERGFVLERSSNGTDFTVLANLAAGTTGYVDTLPVPGGTYYYRLAATNIFGASDYSNLAAIGVALPPVSSGLRAVRVTDK